MKERAGALFRPLFCISFYWFWKEVTQCDPQRNPDRPTDDSKCIDCAVYSLLDGLEKFTTCRNCREANSSCVCIDPPYRVYAERQFVIINYKIVSGCQYWKNGENCVSASIPNRVISFVSHIVERTSENGPYVLDIADTDVGLKVLEANIFLMLATSMSATELQLH